MVFTNELRTGNIVLVNNRLRKVNMISNSETLTDQSLVGVEGINHEGNEDYSLEDIHPVPMSKAVLEQGHFTYQPYFKFWQLISTDDGRIEMDIDPDYNLIDFMRRPVVKNIASLHQLQNIYYMLHGKELDFDVDTTVMVDGLMRSMPGNN